MIRLSIFISFKSLGLISFFFGGRKERKCDRASISLRRNAGINLGKIELKKVRILGHVPRNQVIESTKTQFTVKYEVQTFQYQS